MKNILLLILIIVNAGSIIISVQFINRTVELESRLSQIEKIAKNPEIKIIPVK